MATKINSRKRVSFAWAEAIEIVGHIQSMDSLGDSRREQYSTSILLDSASGLRGSELFALRVNDIDFKARTIRVKEASDQRSGGKVDACKNVAGYRTVHLGDAEGHAALERLKAYLVLNPTPSDGLIFHSKRGAPSTLAAQPHIHNLVNPTLHHMICIDIVVDKQWPYLIRSVDGDTFS